MESHGEGQEEGDYLFWSLVPTWAWWVSGCIPKVWEERLLLRSRRSLQPPEAPRVSGGITGQETELKEGISVM